MRFLRRRRIEDTEFNELKVLFETFPKGRRTLVIRIDTGAMVLHDDTLELDGVTYDLIRLKYMRKVSHGDSAVAMVGIQQEQFTSYQLDTAIRALSMRLIPGRHDAQSGLADQSELFYHRLISH